MGWSSLNGDVSTKEYITKNLNKECTIVASNTKGCASYLAVKQANGNVYATVILRKKSKDETLFKVIDETSVPFYYGASKKVLDALSETDSECALEWREMCQKKREKSKTKIGIGTKFKYRDNILTVIECLGRKGYIITRNGEGLMRLTCRDALRLEMITD